MQLTATEMQFVAILWSQNPPMDKTADYFKIISDMRVVLIYMIALSMEWKSHEAKSHSDL